MSRHQLAKAFLFLIAVSSLACSKSKPVTRPTPASEDFLNVVAAADHRVDSGDYAGADRILSDFAIKTKGTQDATEISFFRALYMVDPQNRNSSVAEGLRALDIYLSTPGAKQYKTEATIVKRTALTLQSLRTASAAPKVIGRDTVFVTREDEIAALKDQLAKANAELDRIKKRLANPSRLTP